MDIFPPIEVIEGLALENAAKSLVKTDPAIDSSADAKHYFVKHLLSFPKLLSGCSLAHFASPFK